MELFDIWVFIFKSKRFYESIFLYIRNLMLISFSFHWRTESLESFHGEDGEELTFLGLLVLSNKSLLFVSNNVFKKRSSKKLFFTYDYIHCTFFPQHYKHTNTSDHFSSISFFFPFLLSLYEMPFLEKQQLATN